MYDKRDEGKRRRSAEIFSSCLAANSLVISTQVIQEFFVSVTKKLSLPVSKARALVADLCDLRVVTIGTSQIKQAVDLSNRIQVFVLGRSHSGHG